MFLWAEEQIGYGAPPTLARLPQGGNPRTSGSAGGSGSSSGGCFSLSCLKPPPPPPPPRDCFAVHRCQAGEVSNAIANDVVDTNPVKVITSAKAACATGPCQTIGVHVNGNNTAGGASTGILVAGPGAGGVGPGATPQVATGASGQGGGGRVNKLIAAGCKPPSDAGSAVSALLQPYNGPGGGHHVPAKAGFRGAQNYSENLAPAIPNEELERLCVDHGLISGAQTRLYKAFAKTGSALTWSSMKAIEVDALEWGGMSRAKAEATVDEAIARLKAMGVTGPTRIPWG
jgi:hypothetical protein